MTKKTVVMAAAAAMGFAVSADVVEVKFTVKTDVDSKVASKVVSGLYDKDTGKHVFWTAEKREVELANGKRKKVSTNEVITSSYFGFVNDATVAKKIGQNAELIWGENDENVLVAGAWGTEKSKSGQAAGTFNGKPATGTWSAKLNTKKTFAELCAKNKVVQDADNRTQGVIADLNDKIAAAQDKASADVKAAQDKAAADIKAAQDKAAEEIAAAQKEGAEAVKAAQDKAAEEIAAAEKKAAEDVKAAQDKAAEEIAAAKAEADAALAAKDEKLENALAKLDMMKDALGETMNDPDMPNMFGDYLDDAEEAEKVFLNEVQANINTAQEKFDAYTNSLNVAALQADYDAKMKAYLAASDLVESLKLTNDMITVIDGNKLQEARETEKRTVQEKIDALTGQIDDAQDFVSYTNGLASTVKKTADDLNTATEKADAAQAAFETAQAAFEAAKAAVENYEAPTYENGGLKSFDDFIAEKEAADGPFSTEIAKHDAYAAYKEETDQTKRDSLNKELATAEAELKDKEADLILTKKALEDAQTASTEARANWDKAIETGKVPERAELEKELADLQAQLAEIDKKYDSWKEFSYSDADREAYKQALVDAKEDADKKRTDMENAKKNLDAVGSLQFDYLPQLLGAIGKSLADMYDENGQLLPPEAFYAMFEEYLAVQNGYLQRTNARLEAIADIRKELGL